MSPSRISSSVALTLALGLIAGPALAADPPAAQPPPLVAQKKTQADRDAARALAEQGFDQFQKHRYDNAITLFTKAEERFHAPTHLLFIAQAHEKKGRLLEATAVYRKLAAEPLARDAPQPFRDAQAEAARAIDPLVRRTPKLRVDITGAGAATARLTIADRPATAGTSELRNPGATAIIVEAEGFATVRRSVLLAESAGEVVVHVDMPRSWSIAWPLLTMGVGLGFGGASLGTGLLSHDWGAQADAACKGLVECPDPQLRKMANSRTMRDTSIATGIAGGVLLLGGVTLLIVRPGSKTTVDPPDADLASLRGKPAIAVRAGPSFIGLTGTF